MGEIKRGDIYWTELSPVVGSEQCGYRPTLVIQNDIGNKFSGTVIVAIMTAQNKNKDFHVFLDKNKYKLEKDSYVMMEHIRTIDKWRIGDKISSLDPLKMFEVDQKLMKSIGIENVILEVKNVKDLENYLYVPKKTLVELGLLK